jgi:hypothetical protein
MSLSRFFNPTSTTSAVSGSGFAVPRMTTADRLAIVFTASDRGMRVYDVTLGYEFWWSGTAWQTNGGNNTVGSATLVAGTVTVPSTVVAANSIILLTGQNNSGTAGELKVSARTPGVEFTILSNNAADTRLIGYSILSP